jgi:uncharacterized protein YbjT (DUF2867 family)
MKILIFGATGMVGQGVLRECLRDPGITAVTAIGRNATGVADPKFGEIIHTDLLDYRAIDPALTGFDACFFCLGISSAGMAEADYERLTYGVTLAAAEALCRLNPGMVFTYVSGAGTDSTESGKTMWARVKGRTENALLRLPFKAAYMFRPGAIRPLHGIRSKTPSYRWLYIIAAPVMPVLQWAFPLAISSTENIGLAMIEAATHGAPKPILETADIHALVLAARNRRA